MASLDGIGGRIYHISIDMRYKSGYWAGFYGITSRFPGYIDVESAIAIADTITNRNNFFDCIDMNNGELYASTVPTEEIDWGNIQAGDLAELESWLNISSSAFQSPTNTFKDQITVLVGGTEITAPGTYTKEYGNSTSTFYDLFYLTDGTHHIFGSHLTRLHIGFNPRTVNYQVMLPVPLNGSITYYFFPDFYDECPAGWGETPGEGEIEGYVFSNTTGLPIEGAQVNLEGITTLTDDTGYYKISNISEGTHNIISISTGYYPYGATVVIYEFNLTYHNISMLPVPDTEELNGDVTGFVTDSETWLPIANATVSLAGLVTYSNNTGYYLLSAPPGEQNIVSIATGYQIYWMNITILENLTTYHNISMDRIQEDKTGVDDPGIGSGTGVGAGVGPGEGPGTGPGVGPGVDKGPYLEKPEILKGVDYWISIKELNKRMRVGNFMEDTLYIFSYKNGTIDIELRIEGNVSRLTTLDKTSLRIKPQSGEEIKITTYGIEPPGRYNGSLIISGAIQAELPIKVWVTEEDKLPVEALMIQLDPVKKILYSGDIFKYKVDLQNLLTDMQYDVNLVYTISDTNNTFIEVVGYDDITIQTSFSMLKNYPIPINWKKGDYILGVKATYLNLTSSATTVFTIVEPWYMYLVFGKIRLWIILAAIGGIGFTLFLITLIRKRMQAKKRFHVKVEYNLLPKPGDRSLFVGNIAETTHKAYFDMDKLTVHTIVAGSTGGGKSIAAQDIVEECLLKGVGVVVFDPTAQWSGMLRKLTDKKFLNFYSQFGLDPKKDPKSFPGNIKAVLDGREVINIFEYIKEGEVQVFTTNKLKPEDYDLFVANMIKQIFSSNLSEFRGLRYLVVFDEIHRILPKFGGSGQGFVQIERACREFRKWGIGVLLISQVLQDFVGQIKANINTQVQMKTRDEGDLAAIKTKFGESYVQELVKSPVGSGMIQNSDWNRGIPYYITFRPILHSVTRLTDDELAQYNKYNEIADDLKFQCEQLEEKGIDVFDLKLELKLAVDKIKTGNFNMVEVYLEGLKPRVTKNFEKLGLSPKKREIKLVDEAELKAEIEAAKKEREELEKTHGSSEEKKEYAKLKKVILFEKRVGFNDAINFNNGATATSLQELLDILKSMSLQIYKQHVTEEKNEIGEWVINVIGARKLGEDLSTMTTKPDMIKRLEEEEQKHIKVDDVQNPKPEEKKPENKEEPKKPPIVPQQQTTQTQTLGNKMSQQQTNEQKSAVTQRPTTFQAPTRSSETEGTAMTNKKITDFNAMVKRSFFKAQEGKRQEALQEYNQLQAVYKTLPPEIKKRAYPICIDLYKKITVI